MDLQKLIEKTVEGLGYELVMLEMSPRGRKMTVYIDQSEKPKGVDVDDCTLVSNQLSHVFNVEEVDYDRLEVSSPGLDRPLTKPAHFRRFVGSEVSVRLRVPVGNRRNFQGILAGCDDETMQLKVGDESFDLPYANVERARLVPKY